MYKYKKQRQLSSLTLNKHLDKKIDNIKSKKDRQVTLCCTLGFEWVTVNKL